MSVETYKPGSYPNLPPPPGNDRRLMVGLKIIFFLL